jgi:hypothetical protein
MFFQNFLEINNEVFIKIEFHLMRFPQKLLENLKFKIFSLIIET